MTNKPDNVLVDVTCAPIKFEDLVRNCIKDSKGRLIGFVGKGGPV